MTVFDVHLAELASEINSLSKRSLVALYWACSEALVPEFLRWAAHNGESTEPLLRKALDAAYRFAICGTVPVRAEALLREIEASTPFGESRGRFASTAAQDCWFCAEVCIRALVDPQCDMGPVIEYALEPIMHKATEDLFGVSQVGSGDTENEEMRQVVAHPAVASALDFLRWASTFLRNHPSPTDNDLAVVQSRSVALAP